MPQVDVEALDELVRNRKQREELERQRDLNFGTTVVVVAVEVFILTASVIRQGKASGQSSTNGAATAETEEPASEGASGSEVPRPVSTEGTGA